ncbi:SDR family oxidoreductase [Algivirga pacifica]|uniref:dTDP-4-dehydrorhamnose reductase n=1 Tax=Algivirga pacifica TaxID=1162670 RepID=A0ABP9D3L8_9BACT
MNKKTILITGSNGLLGQTLLELLADSSHEIIGCGKGPDRFQAKGYTYYSLDISKTEDVNRLFQKVRPTHVLHTAALTQVDICEEHPKLADQVNILGTQNICQAAKNIKAHLLYVSTDFIFSGDKGMLTEDEKPMPPNYYGETKLKGEVTVQQSNIPWTILRTVLVYGVVKDMSRSNIILWVKNNLEQGNPIKVVNDQWRTPTYVKDLAKGCLLALEKEATGIYHLSGKDYMTPYQMALATADYFKLDKTLITPTNAQEFKEIGKRPLKTGFNIQKAMRELSYAPLSFQEGLQAMMEDITRFEQHSEKTI